MGRRLIGELIESKSLEETAKEISFADGILYPHNQVAYIKLIDAIKADGKGCAINATGTGKMFLALKWLKDSINLNEPFVYIAPTNVILNRFVDLIIDTFFPKEATKLKKKSLEDEIAYLEKNLGLNLHLYTYAKINRMTEDEMKEVRAKRIVLDEFHRCGADKWGKSVQRFLELNSDAEIMGLSATPIRPSDGKNMVEEMFDGKIATQLTLVDALEQGILPLPLMVTAMYTFENEVADIESRRMNNLYDPEKQAQIDKKLKELKNLLGQAGGIKEVFRESVEELTRNKGKTDIKFVVFCKDIADRDIKMDECRNWFDRSIKIKKYSVTSKESEKSIKGESAKSKKLRSKVIETFEQDNSKGIKLLFAVDMLNEGLHVKNLDGVIMMRDTSSQIVFLQQLGRALSVNDTNTQPLVFDLCNNIEVLGEDIEEYREVLQSLTRRSSSREREMLYKKFEIQAQIIDVVKHLKELTSSVDIRPCIIEFVEKYKAFIATYHKHPQSAGEIEGERNLYCLWSRYTNPENLQGKEKEYLEQNGIEVREIKEIAIVEGVRECVVEFVERYKKFVVTYHKKPQMRGKIERETSLYLLWLRYTNPENLQGKEREFIDQNGIKVREIKGEVEGVRECVIKFVEKYKKFVKNYNKNPHSKGSLEGENVLYGLMYRYTNPENLQGKEKKYLEKNGIKVKNKVEGVRDCIVRFVEKYEDFVETYNKRPQYAGKIEGENHLYALLVLYTNPDNLKAKEETQYLIDNGIKVRELESKMELN